MSTTSKAEPKNEDSLRSFIQAWAESLSLVLSQIAATPFSFESSGASADDPPASANDAYITVTAGGALQGELSLRIPADSATFLVKTFVAEQSERTELAKEDPAALEELFRQVAGYLSSSSKGRWQELSLTLALAQAPSWPAAASGWIRSASAASQKIAMEWQLNDALNLSLASAPLESVVPPPPAETASVTSDPARLGFFMDLELDVILRFGGRDLLLKEVLELGPGSVLELDRSIHDPADLLLDGKLIARGEVVMVNGNYGLRVTEAFAGTQVQH